MHGVSAGNSRIRGFTLIEALVVIAIVFIVLSIVVVSLRSLRKAGKLAEAQSRIQSNASLVLMYAQDSRDYYPIGHRKNRPLEECNPHITHMDWHYALVKSGHLSNSAQADPRWFASTGFVSDVLSIAMNFSAEQMQPGSTVDPAQARAKYIGQHQVRYPQSKGLMITAFMDHPDNGTAYFCCGWPPFVQVPVVSADMGVKVGRLTDFIGAEDGDPWIVDDVGIPVISTWGGVLATDW